MSRTQPSNSSSSIQWSCRHFEFREILIATENFDESLAIGSGGFGKVYKGNVTIGTNLVAAIKRLDSMSNQGAAEFWAEVEMLSMLRHCNLVSLNGYCNYEQEMILGYGDGIVVLRRLLEPMGRKWRWLTVVKRRKGLEEKGGWGLMVGLMMVVAVVVDSPEVVVVRGGDGVYISVSVFTHLFIFNYKRVF
ncbi:hypothetical protein R6Q57_016446 [Mikania cordata]